MIKKKKISAEVVSKFLFKEEGRVNVKSLAPAAAAIITELNKEELWLAWFWVYILCFHFLGLESEKGLKFKWKLGLNGYL